MLHHWGWSAEWPVVGLSSAPPPARAGGCGEHCPPSQQDLHPQAAGAQPSPPFCSGQHWGWNVRRTRLSGRSSAPDNVQRPQAGGPWCPLHCAAWDSLHREPCAVPARGPRALPGGTVVGTLTLNPTPPFLQHRQASMRATTMRSPEKEMVTTAREDDQESSPRGAPSVGESGQGPPGPAYGNPRPRKAGVTALQSLCRPLGATVSWLGDLWWVESPGCRTQSNPSPGTPESGGERPPLSRFGGSPGTSREQMDNAHGTYVYTQARVEATHVGMSYTGSCTHYTHLCLHVFL